MNVIEELIERGLVRREAFDTFETTVFERIRAELANDNSRLSKEIASAQRKQATGWAAMAHQVVGAERPDPVLARPVRDYSEISKVAYG